MKKKVLILNDYNLAEDIVKYYDKVLPGHLIFGLDKLKSLGFDWELMRLWEPGRLYHVDNFLIKHKPILPLGRLETQVKALRKLKEASVILSLKETESNLLHYMRATGLLQTPVVTLVHHSQDIGRLSLIRSPINYLWHKGADAVLTFSSKIKLVGSEENKTNTIRWGPDTHYYDSLNPTYGEAIVSSGRSGRDFDTFAQACIHQKAPAKIFCLEHNRSALLRNLPPFISCEIGWQEPHLAFQKQKDALAIAIPLTPQPFTSGLTSLCDALGLGKAILMPENMGIDLDIENLGIGKIVYPNNLEGWRRTVRWVQEHSEETVEMGKRAREFASQHYNSDIFAHQLAEVLYKVIEKRSLRCI